MLYALLCLYYIDRCRLSMVHRHFTMEGRSVATTFKAAMDLLCLKAGDVATLFKVPVQHVRQWRLDPDNSSYRAAPAGWQRKFLPKARKRGAELERLTAELEAAGDG